MMEPDRRVIVALSRPGSHDRDGLARRTRLGEVTLDHTLRKLTRMGWIAGDDGGFRLTGAGRHTARRLRGGQ